MGAFSSYFFTLFFTFYFYKRIIVTMKKNDFTKGKISSQIMHLAIPMTFAQLVNVLYNVVDRMYIGRIANVGSIALSGVGITFPIITIIIAFANLAGNGGAPLSSIERGKGNDEKASLIMGNSFLMLCVFSVILTLVVYVIKEPVLYLFGASKETFSYANEYLSIYVLGTLFTLISLGLNAYINAQGFAKQGMLTICIGAIINLIFDPLFIFTFNMGVKGAALVSVIAQFISMVWTIYFLRSDLSILKLSKKYMRWNWSISFEILSLGLSGFIMAITNSIVQIVCNATLSVYGGDIYIGIMTIINSVREMMFMPVSGITSASQPVMSYNYGANKHDRVKQCIRFMSVVCVVYSLLSWLVLFLFPEAFIRIFSSDSKTIALGIPAFHIYYFGIFFMAFQFSAQSTFTALNKPKQAVFFSIFRKVIIVTPLTILLPTLPSIGIMGVFLAEPISNLIGGLASYLTMYFSVYIKLKPED